MMSISHSEAAAKCMILKTAALRQQKLQNLNCLSAEKKLPVRASPTSCTAQFTAHSTATTLTFRLMFTMQAVTRPMMSKQLFSPECLIGLKQTALMSLRSAQKLLSAKCRISKSAATALLTSNPAFLLSATMQHLNMSRTTAKLLSVNSSTALRTA